MEIYENPFTCLNTESNRTKHFEQKWKIVETVEYILCVQFDMRKDKTTGAYTQVSVNDKFMYVPIIGSLSSMFRNFVTVSKKQNQTRMVFTAR